MNIKGESIPWTHGLEFPTLGSPHDTSPSSWIEVGLMRKAIHGGPPILVTAIQGNVRQKPAEFVKKLNEALGLRSLRIFAPPTEANSSYVLGSDEAMASCRFHNRGTWVEVSLSTASEESHEKAKAFIIENVIPDDPAAGPVYTLAKTRDGYRLHRMGAAGVPLQRENYAPGVIDAYDHIVADLNTTSPCGRLVVLAGEPGTGKTYLVRSLLREARQTTFVMISPHLVKDLGDPEILPSLTQAKDELPGPILLVLEDADMCLVPRGTDNMSTISSLLNLGDGILGSLLDVRILATTNAKIVNMDAAALRDGRLCRKIEVGKLQPDQANSVLKKLVPEGDERLSLFDGVATLAQVYGRARKCGWCPVPKQDVTNQVSAPTPKAYRY